MQSTVKSNLLSSAVVRSNVIAYPTESCYGFGCDPSSRRLVKRILGLKRRPQAKGLILIAATSQQLKPYVAAHALDAAIASGFWPGPVTLLLEPSRVCPLWIRGRHGKVAVRITAHPFAAALCKRLNMALVSTSANHGGKKALRNARQVYHHFGKQVRVIPGKIGADHRPTMIRDLVTGKILRQ